MIGWYIVPFEINTDEGAPGYPLRSTRRIAMCGYNQLIWGVGGRWHGIEVFGNRAIVKVKAPQVVLDTLNGVFKRIPKNRLDDSLSDLPNGVKTALKNEILDMGYSLSEIVASFGNDLGQYTLRDVLQFIRKRRSIPRYDEVADEVVFDSGTRNCQPLEDVDERIQE